MRVYWDVLQNCVSARLGELTTRGLSLVRSRCAYVRVYPVANWQLQEIEDAAFILKRVGQYDSNGVALVQPLVKRDGGYYDAYIDLITIPIDYDLRVDGDPSNDISSVRYMAGFGRMENGEWVASPRFDLTVLNNVSRGSEETPSQPPHGGLHVYSQLTGGVDSIDSIVTLGMPLPQTAFAVVNGVFSVWHLVAGDDASDPSVGIIRPLDYSDGNNERVWKQAA